jgi:RsiW-degrading membrane proteinase PrsW (M82 family)
MNVAFALLPVLLFVGFLFLLDSFKLVVVKILFLSLLWGGVGALAAYFINQNLFEATGVGFAFLSRYFSPFVEEFLKVLLILFLIRKKRIGFMIDAAVYGFAIGAGFALAENMVYLRQLDDQNLMIWLIRGFGTSFMHGGCTSLFAIMLIDAKNREASYGLGFLFGFAMAYGIHSLYNHFYLSPVFQTIGVVLVLPLALVVLFRYNEKRLQDWLEIEFSSEVEILSMINKGQFLSSRTGKYLAALKSKFKPETIVDLYCFIRIYLDLSVKAKRNIMLKECGLQPIRESDTDQKLIELAQLKKQIGTTGELTLAPLIRMNYRDLWKLKSLV